MRDADDPAAQWEGWVPFEAMPKHLAPACGFVATANSSTDPAHTIVFTTTHCEPRYRTSRIECGLAAEQAHTTETFAAMQRDVEGAHVPALRDAVVAILAAVPGEWTALGLRAIDVLREQLIPLSPPTPSDEWERRLFGAAIDCGVAVLNAALSSDGLYD